MELQRAKGTRDFGHAEKIARQHVIDKLRYIFELYGYSPIETPIIERYDVLAAKYAGGSEILKETFNFRDHGDRHLCLRYDLTVPLARFIGMNPNLKMPFKRYAIGEVFRDGPIKTGRYREFWQCDVDVVGAKSVMADAECIKIAQRFFREIGLNVIIEINNRKLLDGLIESLGIDEHLRNDVITAIDKLKKVPIADIEKELEEKTVPREKVDELLKILKTAGSNMQKLEKLRKLLNAKKAADGLNEIEEVLGCIEQSDEQGNVVFEISLARGLAYYTGTVFEVFINGFEFTSSLAGGGRWDRMIGDYLGGEKVFHAVGISFGIEPITELLKMQKKFEAKDTVTELFVIPIGSNAAQKSLETAEKLRDSGVKVDVDVNKKGISKNLEYANSYKIPYVLFVGEEELKKKKLKLKDMETGVEDMLSLNDVVKKLKKQ